MRIVIVARLTGFMLRANVCRSSSALRQLTRCIAGVALYISVLMAARDSFAKDAAADVCAAVCASLLVSPAITIVDRSIMQNASGVMKVTSTFDTVLPGNPALCSQNTFDYSFANGKQDFYY